MADDGNDDVDNEITRIVRRPGPASLPVNVVRPPVPIGKSGPAASDAMPPVAPPVSLASPISVAPPVSVDRPRPVMTPPRPLVPPAPVAVAPSTPGPIPIPVPKPVRPPTPIASALGHSPAPASAPVSVPAAVVAASTPIASAPIPMPAPVAVDQPPVVAAKPMPAPIDPVVGWFVVVKGPGRGAACAVVTGRNGIGSAATQAIRLDFGDAAIAAEGHAYVVYDEEAREFVAEDGKQKVVVRLNGKLLTETKPLGHGDELRIGATTLRFVALCGPDFDWNAAEPVQAEAPSTDERPPAPATDAANDAGPAVQSDVPAVDDASPAV